MATEHQRCRVCGKEWPRYRTDRWDAGFFAVILRLPLFWWHYKFACPRRPAISTVKEPTP
jgi:hypothetical protein